MSSDDGPSALQSRAAGIVKRVAMLTGAHRALFYRYDYMHDPDQLMVLVDTITATDDLEGPLLEVGCAAGHTTVFLDRHLGVLGSERRYVAIDTFAGFTDEDIAVERQRGHDERYRWLFRNYDQSYFDQTMVNNGVTRVTSVKADANTYDFSRHAGASWCLIDVDLYRPVRATLERVLPLMAPGGIVVVDDCADSGKYDGAHQAFVEITEGLDAVCSIEARKLGVIRLPDGQAPAVGS